MEIDIEKLCNLARIELEKTEKEELRKELASILDFVSKLKEVPTEDIESTGHAFEGFNIFREDISAGEKEHSAKFIEQAPKKENNYIKVKQIFGKDGN